MTQIEFENQMRELRVQKGAALTAINAKVDNKIENLSETASAGKYVLTAVRVGDQTTYAWELIDRSESEATTTTE